MFSSLDFATPVHGIYPDDKQSNHALSAHEPRSLRHPQPERRTGRGFPPEWTQRFQHFPDPVRYASHARDRVFEATQHDIALMQRTFAYQNGSHRPRPLSVKDSITAPLAIPLRTAFSSRTGLQQQDSIKQFVNTAPAAYVNELAFTAPTLPAECRTGTVRSNAIRIPGFRLTGFCSPQPRPAHLPLRAG